MPQGVIPFLLLKRVHENKSERGSSRVEEEVRGWRMVGTAHSWHPGQGRGRGDRHSQQPRGANHLRMQLQLREEHMLAWCLLSAHTHTHTKRPAVLTLAVHTHTLTHTPILSNIGAQLLHCTYR